MPAAVRLTDMCTGHGPFPPRPSVQASSDVYINNLGAHRVGDKWAAHCAGKCHDSEQLTGASSVFVNNKALARVGDMIKCGSANAQGSPDVFSGEANSVKPGFSGASYAKNFSSKSDINPEY
jgi:uncharacterized Zn-binding protein involved in type VI secretion